ncbi:hypothetical protein SDC9_43867 [bioreactor metagenome]|uniref:Uncharacterized protein n=1 Tax=bioreactor metagenome TaxID=1076179 RepID=A0A644W1R0_9ZZZZ
MEHNLSELNKKGMSKLNSELRKLSSSNKMDFLEENDDALSLMVDETLKGGDIRKEFPSFYHTLTKNAVLRQSFIDAITLDASEIKTDLKISRLIKQLLNTLSGLSESQTKKWQLSIPDLSAIFFPQQKLVYRGPSDYSTHYNLLNKKIELHPVIYSLLLEGALSDEPDKFSLDVDLAISENADPSASALPVELEISWGNYSQHLIIKNEGVTTVTEIPLSAFLSGNLGQVTAAMELSLSRPQ